MTKKERDVHYSLRLQQPPCGFVPLSQCFLVDPVMDKIALLVRCYDVRITKDSKVLRDPRRCDLQGTGQRVDAERPPLQQVNHPHPCIYRKNLEDAGLFF